MILGVPKPLQSCWQSRNFGCNHLFVAEKRFPSPDKFTFGEMQKLVFDFETLIRKRTKGVPPGSKIERAGLTVMEMLATFKKEIPHDYRKDYREEWRRALSLVDILRKILFLQEHPAFNSIWPHILLLLGKNEFAQTLLSPKEDADANKVFELYVALLVLPLCTSIDVEPPKASANGKNPDIIATIQGEPWGIACKVMHSSLAKSMLDRVREGIDQINRCDDIKNGLVVVSLKNVIPHDLTWPAVREPGAGDMVYFSASNDKIALDLLKSECKRYEVQLLDLLGGKDGFRALFKGPKVEPLILAHLCTATTLLRDGKATYSLMRMLVAIAVDNPLPKKSGKLATAMNYILHDRFDGKKEAIP
jgi:hypothetical protein